MTNHKTNHKRHFGDHVNIDQALTNIFKCDNDIVT